MLQVTGRFGDLPEEFFRERGASEAQIEQLIARLKPMMSETFRASNWLTGR
jgi:hypothetical protein